MSDDRLTCQKHRDADGWWTCDHCGSQWHEAIFGDWIPLSCVDRPVHRRLIEQGKKEAA